MRILHLIYDHIRNPWVGGGGAVRVWELYRRLSDRHEITVVCGRYPGASDCREGNVSFKFVGSARDNYLLSTFSYAVRAAGYLKAHNDRYDIVVEDFAPYNPVFSFLRHKSAIIQLHQREGMRHLKKYAVFGIPFFLIEKFYPRFFHYAVVISEVTLHKYGLRGRVVVIPNGFDPLLMDEEPEEKGYMLFLGRLHINQKGLDTLRDAMHMVRGKIVIAGGGKDAEKVRDLFRDDVRADRAELTGFVSGKAKTELLRKCLFMVMSSRYEGQPLTLIEAASCGKAVVVSDIPELRYAVDAGFGLSFKTGDARDLARKIHLLLEDSSMRKEMGRRARAYAADFTWDRIAGQYEKLLTDIAGKT